MEKTVQRIIISALKKKNISYRHFAKMIGCNYRTVATWKSESRGISLDMAHKALKALNIRITIGGINDGREEE